MQVHNIDLTAHTAHGKAEARFTDGILDVWTTQAITPVSFVIHDEKFKRHHVSLPGQYRLPFRLDMTVKLDYPAFLLFAGNGRISFASPWQDNRKIEDIAFPSGKPNQDKGLYDNHLPFNEWVELSVTYNLGETQICIGGKELFYSRKQTYMSKRNRRELDAMNEDGFTFGLAVSKGSVLSVKSMTVTEYKEIAPIERGAFEETGLQSATQGERPKPTFESVISGLPQEYRDEIINMDAFLKSLRPMKFRRAVDKGGGKISWVASDYGFSYHVEPSGRQLSHRLGWYMVYNGKPETWHRKADYMEETLRIIAETDPELAGRIFYALNDCVDCFGSGSCLPMALYEFNGKKRSACHGLAVFRMSHSDFDDVREFIRRLNALMAEKGGIPTEKIYMIKR